MSDDKPKILRETDDEARAKARELILLARFAAIAVIDPESGYPNCSRTLITTDGTGQPVILVSRLAAHTKALLATPKCSLLVGEPGKGDPLAWPRMSLQCDAEPVPERDPDKARLRARFLRRHPKTALYIDFPDFLFFRLRPISASLNGGFGRAYALSQDDLVASTSAQSLSVEEEEKCIESLESSGVISPPWKVVLVDSGYGVMVKGDQQRLFDIRQASEQEG